MGMSHKNFRCAKIYAKNRYRVEESTSGTKLQHVINTINQLRTEIKPLAIQQVGPETFNLFSETPVIFFTSTSVSSLI